MDVFGSYDFMPILMEREKQLYPVSYSGWDSSTLYQTLCSHKWGQWKMSSVTLSLILPWLSSSCGSDTVISSNAGSWLNRLSSSGRNVLADGVAQLPRQLNWHYINTLCQGRKTTTAQNVSLWSSHAERKANFGNKMTFTGKSIYSDESQRWYFKSHLSLLTFNSMTAFYMHSILPNLPLKLSEGGMKIKLAFCQSSCVKWHHCEDVACPTCSAHFFQRRDW